MKSKLNKSRQRTNRKSKVLKGGAAAVAVPRQSENLRPISFLNLLHKSFSTKLTFTMNYKRLQLKGSIFKGVFIIGIDDKKCIKLIFNRTGKETYNSYLTEFFYDISSRKKNCIGKKLSINNNGINKNNIQRNKKINRLLLELLDVLNISINSQYCQLGDNASFTTKRNCVLLLSLYKLLTRGYGFYSEFGYIFKDDTSIKFIDILAHNLEYSTNLLQKIYTLSKNIKIGEIITFYRINKENNQDQDNNQDHDNNQDQDNNISILQLINPKSFILLEQSVDLTLYDFYQELLKYCNSEIDIFFGTTNLIDIQILCKDTDALIKYYIAKTYDMPNYSYQYKMYQYNEPEGTILTSALEIPEGWPNPIDPAAFPTFVMKPFTVPRINITPEGPNNYNITIV